MEYLRLGRTGLRVSELCFGCMSFGSSDWRPWVLDPDDAEAIYRAPQHAYTRRLWASMPRLSGAPAGGAASP